MWLQQLRFPPLIIYTCTCLWSVEGNQTTKRKACAGTLNMSSWAGDNLSFCSESSRDQIDYFPNLTKNHTNFQMKIFSPSRPLSPHTHSLNYSFFQLDLHFLSNQWTCRSVSRSHRNLQSCFLFPQMNINVFLFYSSNFGILTNAARTHPAGKHTHKCTADSTQINTLP